MYFIFSSDEELEEGESLPDYLQFEAKRENKERALRLLDDLGADRYNRDFYLFEGTLIAQIVGDELIAYTE